MKWIGFIELTLLAVQDAKKKKISLLLLVLFLLTALAVQWKTEHLVSLLLINGMAGVLIWGLGCLLKQGIGLGDCILMAEIGVMTGISSGIAIIFLSFFSAAIFSCYLILCRKKNKNEEMPFVPFLLFAYIIVILV